MILPVILSESHDEALLPSHQHSTCFFLPPSRSPAGLVKRASLFLLLFSSLLSTFIIFSSPHPNTTPQRCLTLTIHRRTLPLPSSLHLPASRPSSLPSRQNASMSSSHILRTIMGQAFQDTSDLSISATVTTSRPLPPLVVHACHQRVLEEI